VDPPGDGAGLEHVPARLKWLNILAAARLFPCDHVTAHPEAATDETGKGSGLRAKGYRKRT
jgi:hypothetical protein